MRGRLLDMGQLGALRSQTVWRAVASSMGAGGDPALVLSQVGSELQFHLLLPRGSSLAALPHLAGLERSAIGDALCFTGTAAPAKAEAVVSAIESQCGLELVPSMPTPDELQAVYEWDRKLSSGDEAWTKEASSSS